MTQANEKANKFFGLRTKKNEKFFLINFLEKASCSKKKINITIRPHPSENKNKYGSIVKKFKNLNIKISKITLEEDLKKHYYIIGYNTNAMRLAIFNNNKVISMGNKRIRKFFFNNKNIYSLKYLVNILRK